MACTSLSKTICVGSKNDPTRSQMSSARTGCLSRTPQQKVSLGAGQSSFCAKAVAPKEQLSTSNFRARRGTAKRAQATTASLPEVDKDSFYSVLEASEEPLFIVDCYTAWCGPCKLIMPAILEMQEKYSGKVKFVKLDCNQENKPLAKELGVRVVPTFFFFKGGEQIGSVVGAKTEEIEKLIVESL